MALPSPRQADSVSLMALVNLEPACFFSSRRSSSLAICSGELLALGADLVVGQLAGEEDFSVAHGDSLCPSGRWLCSMASAASAVTGKGSISVTMSSVSLRAHQTLRGGPSTMTASSS